MSRWIVRRGDLLLFRTHSSRCRRISTDNIWACAFAFTTTPTRPISNKVANTEHLTQPLPHPAMGNPPEATDRKQQRSFTISPDELQNRKSESLADLRRR